MLECALLAWWVQVRALKWVVEDYGLFETRRSLGIQNSSKVQKYNGSKKCVKMRQVDSC